ncbi:MAG: Gfo/Idh/MocA family oxidoreductase [Proteobacteria bacterium]|nr:Gfo/Idh/MocA family oxidoreductase [Pseudomonadota bacterium]
MQKKIKTALVGFGFSGSTFHAPFLNSLPQFQVTHVVSDNPELVRKTYPTTQIISKQSILECLANEQIDLIIISAPNSEHCSIAKQALKQNKHVLLEKPFVLDPIQGHELIDLAKERQKILTVYHNRRWDSDFLTLKEVIKQGELGDINLFINRYDRYRPEVKYQRWKESEQLGSGTLWDLGSHLIDQTLTLFGIPDTIYAELLPQRKGAKAIDYFELQFGYKSGLRARLSSSSLCYSPGPKYEVHGSKGSFIKFGQDPQESSLIRNESPLNDNFGQESSSTYGHLSTALGSKQIPSLTGTYITFFKQLYNAILGKQEPPVSPYEALNVIKMIHLCEKSNDLQKLIEVK